MKQEIEHFLKRKMYCPHTHKKYHAYLNHVMKYLCEQAAESEENLDLEKIYVLQDESGCIVTNSPLDSQLIDEYFNTYLAFNAYRLIQTRYALSSFFRYLELNYNFPNPIMNLVFNGKELLPPPREVKTLSKHQLLRLYHVVVTNSDDLLRDLLIFSLLFSTGCRNCEIRTLKVKHIIIQHDSYKLIHTKNGRQRVVVMMEDMGKVLELYCKKQDLKNDDYLLQNNRGIQLSYETLRKRIRKYCKLAKIESFKPHGTRHTFATILYEEGTSLPFIQQLLGQINMNVVEKYIHANHERNIGIKIKQNEDIYQEIADWMKKR